LLQFNLLEKTTQKRWLGLAQAKILSAKLLYPKDLLKTSAIMKTDIEHILLRMILDN
jgi:hypothetical protein